MRLALTGGQGWTVSIGTGLAGLLLVTSLPGVLRLRHASVPSPPAQAAVQAPAGAPAQPATPAGPTPATPAAVPPAPVVEPGGLPPAPVGPAPFNAPGAAPASAPARPAPPPAPSPAPADAPTPLRVVVSAWSSTDSAPLAAAGVPQGGLPVEVRAGGVVDIAYIRLSGTATTLTLGVSGATGATTGPDTVDLMACRITVAGWTGGAPGPAVPYDAADCVRDSVLADGRRSFDLSVFPERSDPRGFALLPYLAGDAQPDRRTGRIVLTTEPT